jgi:hypothetical protein
VAECTEGCAVFVCCGCADTDIALIAVSCQLFLVPNIALIAVSCQLFIVPNIAPIAVSCQLFLVSILRDTHRYLQLCFNPLTPNDL